MWSNGDYRVQLWFAAYRRWKTVASYFRSQADAMLWAEQYVAGRVVIACYGLGALAWGIAFGGYLCLR